MRGISFGEGAVVTGNTAQYSGGGIYLVGADGNLSTLKMTSNSQVYGNEANTGTQGQGGGVYIDSSGTFDISGGSVGESGRGNTASTANGDGAVSNKGTFYYGNEAKIPYVSPSNSIYLLSNKPMTLKSTLKSDVTFTGEIALGSYKNGATVIAYGSGMDDQDMNSATSHFNLASNNYLMYLSQDGTRSIRSTDVTSVNQIKSYPNVSWSSIAITYTVPEDDYAQKAFLVQIDSNTYAICELTIEQAPNNSKRDVTLYSIIYKNGV